MEPPSGQWKSRDGEFQSGGSGWVQAAHVSLPHSLLRGEVPDLIYPLPSHGLAGESDKLAKLRKKLGY